MNRAGQGSEAGYVEETGRDEYGVERGHQRIHQGPSYNSCHISKLGDVKVDKNPGMEVCVGGRSRAYWCGVLWSRGGGREKGGGGGISSET